MRRVLMVEDEPWIRDDVATLLATPGSDFMIVAACATGEEALRLLRAGLEVELALVDLGLPGSPGSRSSAPFEGCSLTRWRWRSRSSKTRVRCSPRSKPARAATC